jgi:hypothetical protein
MDSFQLFEKIQYFSVLTDNGNASMAAWRHAIEFGTKVRVRSQSGCNLSKTKAVAGAMIRQRAGTDDGENCTATVKCPSLFLRLAATKCQQPS